MDKINKWLAVISNLGIVGGLIFVAVELNQNSTLIKASAYQERSNDLVARSTLIIQSEVLSSAVSKLDFRKHICNPSALRTENLNSQELSVFREFLLIELYRLQNLDQQYQQGLFSEEYHRGAVIGAIDLYMPIWEMFEVHQRTLVARILENYKGMIPDRCIDNQTLEFKVPGDA